jgi:hypothetical protein
MGVYSLSDRLPIKRTAYPYFSGSDSRGFLIVPHSWFIEVTASPCYGDHVLHDVSQSWDTHNRS